MYSQFKSLNVFLVLIATLGTLFIIDASVVSQADAQVVLAEVDYHNDQIEIVNMGASGEDISGWWLCSRFFYRNILDPSITIVEGSTNLEAGGVIVLTGYPLNNDSADLGLYNSSSFGSSAAMQSFVQWGGSGIGREGVAVQKGIWNAGEFVPAVPNGHSIEYDGVGASAAAWLDQANPNFGAFGEAAPSLSTVINEVDYRVNDRVEIKNFSANPIDISSWWFCSLFDYVQISSLEVVEGSTTLQPNATVVVSGFSLNDSAADLVLYNTPTFSNPDVLEAFVQWGSGGNGRESVAASKGIWTAGDFVPLVAEGHSIEYDGDGTTASDWFDQASPTLGVVAVFGITLEFEGESSLSTQDAIAGVTYTVKVTNTGNQDDTINLSAFPEVGIEGTVRGTLSQTSVTLSPAASETITLTVAGDAFTTAGDYEVKVTSISAGDSSTTVEVSTTTTIEIAPVFAVTLEVEGEASQSTTDAATGVTYTLTATNTGNQDDTINLSVSPEAGGEGAVFGTLSQTSVTLSAGASETITLQVTGDASTEPGGYEVKVTGISAGDSSETVEVPTTTTIEIVPVFGVMLAVEVEGSQSTTDPVAGVTYSLKVTNTGNQDDTINLSVSPEAGGEGTVFGTLNQTSVTLGVGASETITLKVVGDASTPAGNHEVKVTATSAGDSSGTAEVATTTTIEKPWDVDGNGTVDISDLVLVAAQFNQSGPNLAGDVNRDDKVDIFDLVTVAIHFGEGTASGAPSARSHEMTANDRTILARLLDTIEKSEDIEGLLSLKHLLRTLLRQSPSLPKQTQLLPNFPNPFNPETWIPYQLAEASDVTVTIYDARGRLIRRFALGRQGAGNYTTPEKAVHWDGRDNSGESVSSGLYFYTLKADRLTQTRRMAILK